MKTMKITNSMQKVAADILGELIYCMLIENVNNDTLSKIVEKVEKKYGLSRDSFTSLPCTTKDYAESSEEYERQVMISRYGYYDE